MKVKEAIEILKTLNPEEHILFTHLTLDHIKTIAEDRLEINLTSDQMEEVMEHMEDIEIINVIDDDLDESTEDVIRELFGEGDDDEDEDDNEEEIDRHRDDHMNAW